MGLPVPQQILMYGVDVLQAVLAVRLCQLGLRQRYPILFAYLVFSLFRAAALSYFLHYGTRLFGLNGYALAYVLMRPLLWVFWFLLILELYNSALEPFAGVRVLGQVLLWSALVTVVVGNCVLILLDQPAGFDPYPVLAGLALGERSVFLALSILVLLLVFLAAHYRLPLRRNVLVLCLFFSAYFVSNALLFALRRYFGSDFVATRNLWHSAFHLLSLLGVLIFVSRKGEEEVRTLARTGEEALESATLLHLRTFNQFLVKVLRQ